MTKSLIPIFTYNNQEAQYALVYSSDPQPGKICSICRNTKNHCNYNLISSEAIENLKPILHFKKGRGGKSVTL